MKANKKYNVMVNKTPISFKSLPYNSHFETEMTGHPTDAWNGRKNSIS